MNDSSILENWCYGFVCVHEACMNCKYIHKHTEVIQCLLFVYTLRAYFYRVKRVCNSCSCSCFKFIWWIIQKSNNKCRQAGNPGYGGTKSVEWHFKVFTLLEVYFIRHTNFLTYTLKWYTTRVKTRAHRVLYTYAIFTYTKILVFLSSMLSSEVHLMETSMVQNRGKNLSECIKNH